MGRGRGGEVRTAFCPEESISSSCFAMAESEVPLVDLREWFGFESGSKERMNVVEKMKFACEKVGFLAISGHGIPSEVIENAWNTSREFFDLSLDEKLKVSMKGDDAYGYEHQEILSLSMETGEKPIADWKETFNVCVNAYSVKWPKCPKDMENHLTRYYREMERLAAEIMRMFALALNLPEHWFDNKIDRNQSALRILNYPHQETAPEEGQVRASAHTDYGSLTILLTDDAPGGLQVLNKDGSWQDVRPEKGAFVVNLGDLMARWTNDRWKSTLHRVVNPPRDLGVDTRRQSIAFFHNPNPDAMIECIVLGENESPKYPPITAQEHLFSKHFKAMRK